ncbi:MAG: DUF2589 domain-containing protein [Nitrospira sp.]|nr:DUF2589 domain-containing protein [Nitrospira sp.]
MGVLSFASLVEAISRAVAKAQDQVERHQITNLLSYFDQDDRPRSILFRVPSRQSGAKPGDEDFYHVPLLSLVSINVLKIKDIEVKFSVDMGEPSEEPTEAQQANVPAGAGRDVGTDQPSLHEKMAGFAGPMKALNVSTTTGRGGGKVRVSLRVTGSEPSEGAARLLDYLAHMQGVYPTITESTPEEGTDKEEQS